MCKYTINDKSRRYFPDFYLPKYDIYLDPKNPYLMQKDFFKMEIIKSMISIIYGDLECIIKQLEDLTGFRSR